MCVYRLHSDMWWKVQQMSHHTLKIQAAAKPIKHSSYYQVVFLKCFVASCRCLLRCTTSLSSYNKVMCSSLTFFLTLNNYLFLHTESWISICSNSLGVFCCNDFSSAGYLYLLNYLKDIYHCSLENTFSKATLLYYIFPSSYEILSEWGKD